MKIQQLIIAVLFLTLTFGISSAEIYKWIDDNGVTHFSDSPTRDVADNTEVEDNDIQSSTEAPADSRPAPEKSTQGTLDPSFFDFLKDSGDIDVALRGPTVEIYETDWCGYCKKAKNFFRARGIQFTAYDIDKDPRAARRMMTMTDKRAVPFVVINGKPIQGYSEQAYTLALQN